MTREDQIKALEKDWAENPRWKNVKRGYSAADVVRLDRNGILRRRADDMRRHVSLNARRSTTLLRLCRHRLLSPPKKEHMH